MNEQYNEDYFEHGVEKKLSGYTNYRYMPTRSYEEASTILKHFGDGSILDYGCAKGFLVHSLRQLGMEAYGYDISEYAIKNSHPRARKYLTKKLPEQDEATDYLICKDVMEHVPEERVLETLKEIKEAFVAEAVFVIPLGDDNKFRIREYEIDVTHVTKKNEDWWIDRLKEAGFRIIDFKYSMGAIKKKWTSKYEYGNGFFVVTK